MESKAWLRATATKWVYIRGSLKNIDFEFCHFKYSFNLLVIAFYYFQCNLIFRLKNSLLILEGIIIKMIFRLIKGMQNSGLCEWLLYLIALFISICIGRTSVINQINQYTNYCTLDGRKVWVKSRICMIWVSIPRYAKKNTLKSQVSWIPDLLYKLALYFFQEETIESSSSESLHDPVTGACHSLRV